MPFTSTSESLSKNQNGGNANGSMRLLVCRVGDGMNEEISSDICKRNNAFQTTRVGVNDHQSLYAWLRQTFDDRSKGVIPRHRSCVG